MTTAVVEVERSGPSVRAVLARFAPASVGEFEAEFGAAIAAAAESLDLTDAEAVLNRWWGIAAVRANPLASDELQQLERARSGDLRGLLARDEHGNWIRL